MMKQILLTMLVLFFSGCTTTIPTITEYKIAPKKIAVQHNSTSCKESSLKISQAFAPTSLSSLYMKYIEDNSKIYTYSQAQWSEPPSQMITTALLNLLRDTKLFKSTQNSKSLSSSEYLLELDIQDFMQHFTQKATNSFVEAVVTLSLIKTSTNKVVATQTFRSKKRVESLDASGGVRALNIALEDILTQNLEFFKRVCK